MLSSASPPRGQPITCDPMRAGEIVFTGMERVVFGRPAADSVAEAADRLGASWVFILAVITLNLSTEAVRLLTPPLIPAYSGLLSNNPTTLPTHTLHSPLS